MSDKDRAKKIAAARKKLKAYQSHDKPNNVTEELSATLKPKLEAYFGGNTNDSTFPAHEIINNSFDSIHTIKTIDKVEVEPINIKDTNLSQSLATPIDIGNEYSENVNNPKVEKLDTIKLLIAEKSNLNCELANTKTALKEKHFEIEEMHTRLISAKNRIQDLENSFFEEQKHNQEYKKTINDLAKEKRDKTTLEEHIQELEKELSNEKRKTNELSKIIQEKNSELELNSIRINQISDETNITIDNRIETLTQTKFMYEQQIVDLQTMVQQLRSEKDQANQQYQNYVQHLTKDLNSLSEKNSELSDELTKFGVRERNFIDHISSLEKQIQQNISKSQNLRDNQEKNALSAEEIENLQKELEDKIDFIEKSKIEYEATIARQREDLIDSQKYLQDKANKIVDLEERLEHILSERPNDAKLLASIESDKIAASRAMAQNSEFRKQIDEIQLKLIELTNDKMDLTTELHSERHANKEMRINYEDLKGQVDTLSEKLFFKDEEMIRLAHENTNLLEKIEDLENHSHHHAHNHEDAGVHSTEENHSHEFTNKENIENKDGHENEAKLNNHDDIHDHQHQHSEKQNYHSNNNSIPTGEAMLRLEERFKKLISEVADLTDEKQRLEHLVLQLQSETETIGEYVALYQTQRRILKQKEFEKDAQLHRLSTEREEFQESLNRLSLLINRLGINVDSVGGNLSNNSKHLDNNVSVQPAEKLNGEILKDSNEAEHLVKEINSIITEIKNKDNMSAMNPIVDHCACCSGTFETI